MTVHDNGMILKIFFEIVASSEPSIRGILIAMAGIAATLGLFLVFLLGSLMAWRKVALICFTVPVATLVAICLVSIRTRIILIRNIKNIYRYGRYMGIIGS